MKTAENPTKTSDELNSLKRSSIPFAEVMVNSGHWPPQYSQSVESGVKHPKSISHESVPV